MKKRLWWVLVPLAFVCCVGPVWWLAATFSGKVRHLQDVAVPNPKLQKAVEVARKSLPMFKGRLKKPEPGERFAIRAMFKSDTGPEYLWLKDPEIDGNGFMATLDEQPAIYRGAKKGDRIHIPESNVYDWLVQKADGSRAGGFTDLALSQGSG